MKSIEVFLILMSLNISLATSIPVDETLFTVTHPELDATFPKLVNESDFKIYFYNQANTASDIQVNITDKAAIEKTSFSNTKETIFIIHGWNRNVSSDICTSIKNAILPAQDMNVFVIDWSKFTGNAYIESFLLLKAMARTLAHMIGALERNNGLDLGKTGIVGHALGAHIAGVLGTALDSKCDYIVGLDPSSPLFVYRITDNRLTNSSAKFVQIIHTCGSLLSLNQPFGTADYFPNGGMLQDGCGEDITRTCSQDRSYMYYAESIATGHFAAVQCDSYEKYQTGECDGGQTSWMGGLNIDKSASGSYYLDTNSAPPFAKSH